MIYPDVTVEEWCRRYPGLVVDKDCCPSCGVERIADLPVAFDSYRGFISKPHSCGPIYDLGVYVSVNPDIGKSWNSIFERVISMAAIPEDPKCSSSVPYSSVEQKAWDQLMGFYVLEEEV